MSKTEKIIWIAGTVILFVTAIIVMPIVIKKITGKVYKNSHEDIDFEDMGPEIVEKDTEEEDVKKDTKKDTEKDTKEESK